MIVSKQNLSGKLTNKQLIQGVINKATEIIEVYPEIQSKTVTPTKQTQTILPDENIYALSQVTVNPIPNNYIVPQGQKEITENGIYNVTTYETANVEIETGKLTNEEYTEANDDLDDILEGSTPATKIYPPDWSEIGYEDTPKAIVDDFDYSKEIYDNWNNSTTDMYQLYKNDTELVYMPKINSSNVTNMREAFSGCSSLIFVPLLNTENATNMRNIFGYCSKLKSIPQIDTSKVTEARQMFAGCSELVNVPVLDMSSATNMSTMFNGCAKLSNDSLNNIMQMCIGATSFTGTKTLAYLSISSTQATICQGLSNYQAFLNAGWTTGY